MNTWVVNVDSLTDDDLSFHGWVCVDLGEEFSLYWNPRYNEHQVIANDPPRRIVVGDYNDAVSLSKGPILLGPSVKS